MIDKLKTLKDGGTFSEYEMQIDSEIVACETIINNNTAKKQSIKKEEFEYDDYMSFYFYYGLLCIYFLVIAANSVFLDAVLFCEYVIALNIAVICFTVKDYVYRVIFYKKKKNNTKKNKEGFIQTLKSFLGTLIWSFVICIIICVLEETFIKRGTGCFRWIESITYLISVGLIFIPTFLFFWHPYNDIKSVLEQLNKTPERIIQPMVISRKEQVRKGEVMDDSLREQFKDIV